MRIRSAFGIVLCLPSLWAYAADPPAVAATEASGQATEEYFAIVGEEVVPVSEYAARLRLNSRNRFYHGKVPEEEVAKFKQEIADQVVDRVLLLQEAARLKIQPDKETVDTRLAQIETSRSKDQDWLNNKERLIPKIRKQLEDDSVLDSLEKKIRDVPKPKRADVKRFYESSPDKFTAPEQIKVSIIMLRVDPSAPSNLWDAAFEEASTLVAKLRGGADFAELARIHSGDDSAINGGDMGYIHKGMLAVPAQNVLDLMSPNDISEPVVLLQGVAVFRLDDRVKAKLNPFDKVKDRVESLLQRDQGDKAWRGLAQELRKKTKIEVNASLFKPGGGNP